MEFNHGFRAFWLSLSIKIAENSALINCFVCEVEVGSTKLNHEFRKYSKNQDVVTGTGMMDLSPSGEPVEKKPVLAADGSIASAPVDHPLGSINAKTENVTVEVDQLNIEILPVIYDIIRCVEKDPLDNATKQRESHECSQKILELQKRFDSARAQIKQLPGIEYNKEEQLRRLELLRNQLKQKQQLINKFKDTKF